MDETFTLLPLHLDPSSKAISAPTLEQTSSLVTELALLNQTHRQLLTLDTPSQVPPAPLPLNPKRSAQINKMREQGNTMYQKSRSQPSATSEAGKLYSYALEMALLRPAWEPSAIVRDEVAVLLANRAQVNMSLQAWPEGAADAEGSVEMKRQGNAKAWWRRGKCLVEMGKWEEAAEWVAKGLEAEGNDAELRALMKEIEKKGEQGSI